MKNTKLHNSLNYHDVDSDDPVNVYIGFDDSETHKILKKEYLSQKDFKIVKENNTFLGRKKEAKLYLNDQVPIKTNPLLKMSKPNNTATYLFDRNSGSFSVIIEKGLLKNEKQKVKSIKDNIKLKQTSLNSNRMSQNLENQQVMNNDGLIDDQFFQLFEGPIKKKEDIIIKQKYEVNLLLFRTSLLIIIIS